MLLRTEGRRPRDQRGKVGRRYSIVCRVGRSITRYRLEKELAYGFTMKGIVLAGGLGTRLKPLTKITNKHLLPIYNKPMIYYPIQMLVEAGIEDIMIVTGGNHAGEFLRLLGNGHEFGLKRLHYTYQEGEGGIAEALGLTEEFADGDRVVVVLGDNILEHGIRRGVEAFRKQERGARIFLKEVEHPWEYGIAEIEEGRIRRILKPSARGELEITDVNNAYLERGELEYEIVSGWWLDAGENHEALLRANLTIARREGVTL